MEKLLKKFSRYLKIRECYTGSLWRGGERKEKSLAIIAFIVIFIPFSYQRNKGQKNI